METNIAIAKGGTTTELCFCSIWRRRATRGSLFLLVLHSSDKFVLLSEDSFNGLQVSLRASTTASAVFMCRSDASRGHRHSQDGCLAYLHNFTLGALSAQSLGQLATFGLLLWRLIGKTFVASTITTLCAPMAELWLRLQSSQSASLQT